MVRLPFTTSDTHPSHLGPGLRRRPAAWRYARSSVPLLAAALLISLGLTGRAFLSHPVSPARAQQIGWQEWEIVEYLGGSASGGQSGIGSSGDGDGEGKVGQANPLPLDVWDPLAVHTTGITELAVKSCIIPPTSAFSFCRPASSSEDDKTRGKWVRVESNLNKRTGLWNLHVYYRRTRRLDVPLVTHIRTVPEPQPADLDLEGWVQAEGDLHDGLWPRRKPLRLWYKTRPGVLAGDGGLEQADGPDEETDAVRRSPFAAITRDVSEIITEVDVLYGDDAPFFGFERVSGPNISDTQPRRWESVALTYRRGNPMAPTAPLPQFHENGTYRIMQIADLHYSVGKGSCRDTDKKPCGDKDTEQWLQEALDAEQPDIVVFSGDQLNGQKTSYNSRSVLAKFAKPVIDRRIPYAVVFGNHDSEYTHDRSEQMRALQQMPYCLARAGPAYVDGVGNYDIRIYSPDGSRTHIFTLYFLDSHDYQKSLIPLKHGDYDYIKQSQIDWFLRRSASVKPIARPFQPDGGTDLDKIWGRSAKKRLPRQTTWGKPNAMAFFHIPLPEAYDEPDTTSDTAQLSLYEDGRLDLGAQNDWEGASKHNGNFFRDAVKIALEVDGADREGQTMSSVTEVKVLSHGHCHNTDRCRRVSGVWMCFDGGSSYSGYGQLGFDRRVRMYELSDWGERIESYKRLTSGEIIDRQVLVGDGAPTGWGQE